MPENHEEAQVATLGIGEGGIDPQSRVNTGEVTNEQVDLFAHEVASDRFQKPIDPTAIPNKCVDGRCECGSAQTFGPNAAGGTFSLVMADALTTNSYRHEDEKAPQHAERLYGELIKAGHKIGGHTDERASGDASGCGAQDKLDVLGTDQPSILEYMTRRGDDVRKVIESLGIEVDDELHASIVAQAQTLRGEHYATTGADLKQSYVDASNGDEQVVPAVEGDHKEVVLLVNTQEGTTLNREFVKEELGEDCQAFNLDVHGLENGAEAISIDSEEASEKFIAALYYNVATASVLAGPSLRIAVR